MRKMEIKQTSETSWTVISDSGNSYTVRYLGRDEDEGEFMMWSCDCPAGQHGRQCKHQTAVANQVHSEGDRDRMDTGMGNIFGCRPSINVKRRRSMADRYGC